MTDEQTQIGLPNLPQGDPQFGGLSEVSNILNKKIEEDGGYEKVIEETNSFLEKNPTPDMSQDMRKKAELEKKRAGRTFEDYKTKISEVLTKGLSEGTPEEMEERELESLTAIEDRGFQLNENASARKHTLTEKAKIREYQKKFFGNNDMGDISGLVEIAPQRELGAKDNQKPLPSDKINFKASDWSNAMKNDVKKLWNKLFGDKEKKKGITRTDPSQERSPQSESQQGFIRRL